MWIFCKKQYGVTPPLSFCAGPRLQCAQAGGITGSMVVCKSHMVPWGIFPWQVSGGGRRGNCHAGSPGIMQLCAPSMSHSNDQELLAHRSITVAGPARGWVLSKVGQASFTCSLGFHPTARYRQQCFLRQKSRVASPVQQTVPAEAARVMPSDGVHQSGRFAGLPGTQWISTKAVLVSTRSPV